MKGLVPLVVDDVVGVNVVAGVVVVVVVVVVACCLFSLVTTLTFPG